MTAGKLCTRDVSTAELDETATAAAERMRTHNVGTLVVIGPDHLPSGILTDRDLVTRVIAVGRDPDHTLVADIVTPQPARVLDSSPIETALATMRRCRVRRLLVVDDDGALVGLLSVDDVLALLGDELRNIGQIVEASAPHRGPGT